MQEHLNFYTLVLGHHCNNNCIFCTRPSDPSIKSVWGFVEEKSFATVFREIASARKRFDSIVLSGGEPTTRRDFFKILQACCSLGFERISVQSNARKFSSMGFAEKTLSILGSRSDFYISFHAKREKLFNKLRGTNSFKESLSGIKNLLLLKAPVRINIVVMKPNYRDLPETVRFLDSLGVKAVEFSFVHPNGRAFANRETVVPQIEKVIPFVERAGEFLEKKQVFFSLNDFPLCSLNKCRKNASELFLNEKLAFQSPKISFKAKECQKCLYFDKCPGIWANYLKIFKFHFSPITKL
ncbi:MAG: radical SAM protein [Candidatus Diapherotrites archaeon]